MPPGFDARHDYDAPSDWTRVYASDWEQAAERFADRSDSYDAEFHFEQTVIVRDGNGEYRAYAVEGQMVPSYSARPDPSVQIVKEPEDEPDSEEEETLP